MTDEFDDDLFAPATKRAKPQRPRLHAPTPDVPLFIGPRWPIANLRCRCDALDEVKEPCPDTLTCWNCKGVGTMRRYVPRHLPPLTAGRTL